MFTEHEAQLEVHRRIKAILLDLTDEAITPTLEEDMSDVAEMIVEALELDVFLVDGTTVHASLNLRTPE